MKKMICVLAGFMCYVLCAFSVRADVIWEPQDAFYEKHASECDYVNRCFTANGPDGVVIVYKSPEIPEVVDTWENGYQVSISHTYKDGDGVLWGIYDNYKGKCGWVPMDYMELVYDSISFMEEYKTEIQAQEGEIAGEYLDTEVYFWEYPGAEVYTLVTAQGNMPEYRGMFIDENGNRWGHVGYYYGVKDSWICVDKPGASYEELYPEGAPQRGEGPASSEEDRKSPQDSSDPGTGDQDEENGNMEDRIVPKGDNRAMTAALAMVALVVVVTAVLLKVLGRRGEKKDSL